VETPKRYEEILKEKIEWQPEVYAARVVMPKLLSADATFAALRQAVDELSRSAPKDHDVLIQAFGIAVVEVRYIEPHTFLFSGFNDEGHDTFVACHFTQLVAHVSYLPKRGKSRIITGFAHNSSA
jgi:hypothetical protein